MDAVEAARTSSSATAPNRVHESRSPLDLVEGAALFSAAQALLKGLLEAEIDVHQLIVVRRPPFQAVLAAVEDAHSMAVLERNALQVISVLNGTRAIELAAQEAAHGRRSVVLLPNDDLDGLVGQMEEIGRLPLSEGGGIVLVLEDHPIAVPTTCPRRVCRRAGLTAIEAVDVDGLRGGCDVALRLTRATRRPAVLIAHIAVLRSAATLHALPNRRVARVDHDAWLRRRRLARTGESADPLRIIRVLELNSVEHLPSPGEREQYGFIAIGPALVSVRHMLDELGMTGRVPVLGIGAPEPLDEAAVGRILERCNHVVVLEARPGSVAPRILAAAESLRAAGSDVARVWWSRLPPAAGDVEPLGANDALVTSLLTRRVIRLLHEMRPGLQLEDKLARIPASIATIEVRRRGENIGVESAERLLRSVIHDADALLAERVQAGEESVALVSVRQGVRAGATPCVVESWSVRDFLRDGVLAVRQASVERQRRVIVVFDFGVAERVDVERLVRAAAGAEGESRLRVVTLDVNDSETLRDALVAGASADALTLVIARDGPPPRRDVDALERVSREVDRDGFLRFQRFILPADHACELRDPGLAAQIARGLLRGSDPLRPEPLVDRSLVPGARGLFFRLESLLEQVEIIRTRPPPGLDALRSGDRLPVPQPIHGDQGLWRAHLGGFRGEAPGVIGSILSAAGRHMGFAVSWTHRSTPLGPGRSAWAQVVFTRLEVPVSDSPEATPRARSQRFTTQIPYGEADLVLGIDPLETIRALATDARLRVADPQRTALVANSGTLDDQISDDCLRTAARLSSVVEATCNPKWTEFIDLAEIARATFLTDRPVDVIALGVAFQRGWIPVSLEALEQGIAEVEASGIAAVREGVQLGRRIAAGLQTTATTPRESAGSALGEDADGSGQRALLRLVRIATAGRQMGSRRQRTQARRMRRRVGASLQQLSGLLATRHGHDSLQDFAVAMRRCEMWGGLDYALQYAETITNLCSADPTLELPRLSILPLAEAFLIRDLWYIGTLTTSIDESHRIRETLGVRLARGDEIRRRYLHRLEARIREHRWVVEFRSSDWPDRILRFTRRFVPLQVRGTVQTRALRETMSELLARAAREPDRTALWIAWARRMHDGALAGTVRAMTDASVRQLAVDSGALQRPISAE
jgi:indolepyruvate ferredoxin oxidoreductase